MAWPVLRRIVLAIPLLWVVLSATFLLQQLIPGDPASYLMGTNSSVAERRQFDASLGLVRSLGDQYASTMGNALRGDLGVSWVTRTPVTSSVMQAMPVTLWLAVLTSLVALVVGTGLGTVAATRRGGWPDRIVQMLAGFGSALPNFWVGVGLVYVLAIAIRAFPATGYVPLGQGLVPWARSLALPVAALALFPTAAIMLQARSAVSAELAKPYVRTLRVQGYSPARILIRHALRNAAPPVIIALGFNFTGLLAGAVVIEQVFNLPGIGSLLLTGVLAHDVPTVQGTVVFFAVTVVLVNLLVDLTVGALTPRAGRP